MLTYQRTSIIFPVDHETLSGWFYSPSHITSPVPCIIMSHGFTALKEHLLDAFARKFVEAGFCVLVYDQRNCGESSGEPRYEINPQIQISDYSHAISFVQKHAAVNPNAIGIWGTSFSGGHVLVVAVLDRRVKSVVAQVPFILGHHEYLKQNRADQWKNIQKTYQDDLFARQQGKPPQMMQVVSRELNSDAIMKGDRAYDFFSCVASWPNQVTLQSVAMSGDYNPGSYVNKISPTPVLFIVADHDSINPTKLAIKAYEHTSLPKKLVILEGDHFSPYLEKFDEAVQAALEWYGETLI